MGAQQALEISNAPIVLVGKGVKDAQHGMKQGAHDIGKQTSHVSNGRTRNLLFRVHPTFG